MSRWKLVVGVTLGLVLFGCKKPPETVEPVEPVEPVGTVDEDLEKAKALVVEGEALFVEGKLDEAEAKANDALALKPELEEANQLLQKVQDERKRLDDMTAAEKAAEKKRQIAAYLRAAQECFDREDYSGAIDNAKKAQKDDPENLEAKKIIANAEDAKKKTSVVEIRATEARGLKRKADRERARRRWRTAAGLYRQHANLVTGREKDTSMERVSYCEAMDLNDRAQRAERAGRLTEAERYYVQALAKSKIPSIQKSLAAVKTRIRDDVRRREQIRRFDKLMSEARALKGRGRKQEAIKKLQEAAAIRAAGPRAVQATEMLTKLRKEAAYDEQVAAANAAIEAEDWATADRALTDAARDGELPAELQQKHIECKFQICKTRGYNALDAEQPEEAIEAFETALKYKEDDEVAAKLEEVKDLKAADDVVALIAAADEALAAEPPRPDEAIGRLEVALDIAADRPGAVDPKKVTEAEGKLKKAKADRARILNRELAGKWKEVVRAWKKSLKTEPRVAREALLAEQETFKDSKFARILEKFLKKTDAMIAKSVRREYFKVKKQVDRSEDYEANIQLLNELIESGKLKDTKYEQMAQDLLDAQKTALEEAPPPPPEEPAPPEPVPELLPE